MLEVLFNPQYSKMKAGEGGWGNKREGSEARRKRKQKVKGKKYMIPNLTKFRVHKGKKTSNYDTNGSVEENASLTMSHTQT